MLDFLSGLLTGIGGVEGVVTFLVIVGVAVGAVVLGRLFKTNPAVLARITSIAGTAVLAVEKLAANGEFDSLPIVQRHAAKKAKALEIIELGLRAEGIVPNSAMMALAGFAIEAVLRQFDVDAEVAATLAAPSKSQLTE